MDFACCSCMISIFLLSVILLELEFSYVASGDSQVFRTLGIGRERRLGRVASKGRMADKPLDRNGHSSSELLVPITIAIYFDGKPNEVGLKVSSYEGDAIFVEKNTGSFGVREFAHKLFKTTVSLLQGHSYILQLQDAGGDGLEEPGYYAVYFGNGTENEILMQEHFYTEMHEVIFVAELMSTKAPTRSPAPTISPFPTHSPTMCVEESIDLYTAKDNTKDRTPHFKTSLTSFPETSKYCTPHQSYMDCTNEVREDCQWQFLGASSKKGVCRVDPISKCLQQGKCVCETEDFNGGSAKMGNGVIFHVPVSITSQDISPYRTQLNHFENYQPTRVQNTSHPQDPNFFISRVDFTARRLVYDFDFDSPVLNSMQKTIAFKLHHLYWDLPMKGQIFKGLGLSVNLDTSTNPQSMTINGHIYRLPSMLKRWTCTSVVITSFSIVVAGQRIFRTFNDRAAKNIGSLELGPFTGELFDFRIYQGTLSSREIREFGARCTNPEDPSALQYKRDIENPYYIYGCEPDFERLPADEGGPIPTSGRQTYGSGPFATLWLRPIVNPLNTEEYLDIPEGEFDAERFFQQSKLQAYMWEKYMFDIDMIGFNLDPYHHFSSPDQVATSAASFWNNPCRWLHNFNNGWQYPLYGKMLPKWSVAKHGKGDSNAVFDLSNIYNTRAEWVGERMSFVAHEMFHGVQGHVLTAFVGQGSRWLAESTAEFAADFTFPAANKIITPFTILPSYPLGMNVKRDQTRTNHFMTEALSVNDEMRSGHMYGSWILWWFLAEHAGMPHLVGQVYKNWNRASAYTTGELFHVRMLVENANMDFGDVWATCIAHLRTWDFPMFGNHYRIAELKDFQGYQKSTNIQPPFPRDITLEERKTTTFVNPRFGTHGKFVAGSKELLPGPNGWNCLTMKGVGESQYVSIQIQWDDGLGLNGNVKPSRLRNQHSRCDDDPRFFNNIVVAHNEATDERRYWKMKGKSPRLVSLAIGNEGPVTIHIILVPTPPADYVGGVYMMEDSGFDDRMSPIPVYGYKYNIEVSPRPAGEVSPIAEMENGLIKFDEATPGWWPIKCTCMENPNDARNRCVAPQFDGVGVSESPSQVPMTESPSSFPVKVSLSNAPTFASPSSWPTETVTFPVSDEPTLILPSISPSVVSTNLPSYVPTSETPSSQPTDTPLRLPSDLPSSAWPSALPSDTPTDISLEVQATETPSSSLSDNPKYPSLAIHSSSSYLPTDSSIHPSSDTTSAESHLLSSEEIPTVRPKIVSSSRSPNDIRTESLEASPSSQIDDSSTSIPTSVKHTFPTSPPSFVVLGSSKPTAGASPISQTNKNLSSNPFKSDNSTNSLILESSPSSAPTSRHGVYSSPDPTSSRSKLPLSAPSLSPSEIPSSEASSELSDIPSAAPTVIATSIPEQNSTLGPMVVNVDDNISSPRISPTLNTVMQVQKPTLSSSSTVRVWATRKPTNGRSPTNVPTGRLPPSKQPSKKQCGGRGEKCKTRADCCSGRCLMVSRVIVDGQCGAERERPLGECRGSGQTCWDKTDCCSEECIFANAGDGFGRCSSM